MQHSNVSTGRTVLYCTVLLDSIKVYAHRPQKDTIVLIKAGGDDLQLIDRVMNQLNQPPYVITGISLQRKTYS